jgi:D-glycero-alpha-D-manno-heptose-7-phosphate kinase
VTTPSSFWTAHASARWAGGPATRSAREWSARWTTSWPTRTCWTPGPEAGEAASIISTRSPLRISLGGGGTDLPSYYRDHGGFLIAGAIDRFVYVNVLRPFTPGIFLKYSKLERVEQVDQVEHPIIREALRLMGLRTPQVEITALADIPAGTGLGSSGSFTTALLKALYAHRMRMIDPKDLAELASRIEIDILGEPVGKQDQYIAACGGITCFTFNPDGSVEVEPLEIDRDTRFDLEDNLLMFFTGFSRSAGSILKDQRERTESQDAAMVANLHYVKELGLLSKDLLMRGCAADFGALMHEHWEHKKRRSSGISMAQVDEWYELGRRNGAIGGKLVGAGGGGFLLFYAEDRNRLRHAMARAGLEEVRFRFELEGTKVVLS